MLKITGNRIYLTRGDSAIIDIDVTNQNGEPYEFNSGDKVYFRVGTVNKLEKECNVTPGSSTCTLYLEPEDTMNFKYVTTKYELEFVSADGNTHDTFIADEIFKVGIEQEERDE